MDRGISMGIPKRQWQLIKAEEGLGPGRMGLLRPCSVLFTVQVMISIFWFPYSQPSCQKQ